MQIKASVSELNRDMQNNKMGSLETLDMEQQKACLNSYFDKEVSDPINIFYMQVTGNSSTR